jgi:hypothetical protein
MRIMTHILTRTMLFAGFAVALAAMPFTSEARVGDREWARCVWETAPNSAHNWIAMPTPRWQDNMATPAERLGHRVIAVCHQEAADERRPNRNPRWDALKSALRSARPREFGAPSANAPVVELCRNTVRDGGSESIFRIDIVRVSGDQRVTIFQQHFGDHQGQPLRLPQDLRMVPPAGAETLAECWPISENGELEGA